jgi:hypothetical protein
MVRDSHSLTRAVSAGLVSDAAFPLKDVLLLLQKDGCTPACAYAREFKWIRVYFRIHRIPAANTHRHPGRHLAGVQKTLKTLDSGQHAGMTFG